MNKLCLHDILQNHPTSSYQLCSLLNFACWTNGGSNASVQNSVNTSKTFLNKYLLSIYCTNVLLLCHKLPHSDLVHIYYLSVSTNQESIHRRSLCLKCRMWCCFHTDWAIRLWKRKQIGMRYSRKLWTWQMVAPPTGLYSSIKQRAYMSGVLSRAKFS